MQQLGSLLLTVAFFTTLATALTSFYGAITRNGKLVHGARYGLYASAFLYVAMAGVLWHGYFTHDFSNKYITAYSDTEMPLIYLFTSFWGGEKGALLFWATMLTVFSAIAVHQARDKDVAYLGWAAGILGLAIFFYDILMVFESNPFEIFLTQHGPRDGDGLNPLLQNPTMAIHPPSLLTGYIAFTLPFAFGAAALITGRLDDQWAQDTRKWTLVSWVFLTAGLILGGAWAYEELGWGGFWMWDPVENAGLIPWFTATAFLHSIVIQERRGMLRRWNFSLVCLTFFLTVFGTFLTRSQLIVSIHAFADSKVSYHFLYYMALVAVTSIGLLGWRWPSLKAPERIQSFLSREAFFVLNNVMLCGCAFLILWGTLYSKSNEIGNLFVAMLTNFHVDIGQFTQGQDLGEPWFNRVMVPAGLALLSVTAVGPLLAWRRTTWRSFNRTFVTPLALASVPMLVGTVWVLVDRCHSYAELAGGSWWEGYQLWQLTLESGDVFAFFTIWFCLFVFTGVGVEFVKGGRVRQRKRGGALVSNIWTLTLKAKRRYGGYIVHIGVALLFLSFAGVAFKSRAPETPLHLGDSLKVGQYTLTFVKLNEEYLDGYAANRASVIVMRSGETVPEEHVEAVSRFLEEREYGPFHMETRSDSPKIYLRFGNKLHRDRMREELYITGVMSERFRRVPPSADDPPRTLRFSFLDSNLIQVSPQVIHRQLDDVRRTLGSLDHGRASVVSVPGQPIFRITWETAEDFARVGALLRKESSDLPGVMMVRLNPSEDAVELALEDTGYLLVPEVRKYKKHMNPTTEVAIWSRIQEDVYIAMRPGMGQPFIKLVAYVNPMINLLWLGAVIMFLGGIFLILPTDMFLARARRAAAGVNLSGLLAACAAAAALLATTPAHATPQEQAARGILSVMKCACDEGGERVFSESSTLMNCSCPLGLSVRRRVEDFMQSQTPASIEDQSAQLSFFEALFAEDPSNERYVIFSEEDHRYLMENTLCTCGCGKMALSQCPLDCPWSPVYQRRFKVFLALGMDRDEARARYTEHANEVHVLPRDEEPLQPQEVHLNTEDERTWAIPVFGGILVAGVLIGALVIRRKPSEPETVRSDSAVKPPAEGGSGEPELSIDDRLLLEDELDAFEDG